MGGEGEKNMASVLARLGFSFQVSIHVTVALTPDCMEAVRLSAELSINATMISPCGG